MAESDGKAREGLQRKGLDPFEAILETGSLEFLEERLSGDSDWAQEGA